MERNLSTQYSPIRKLSLLLFLLIISFQLLADEPKQTLLLGLANDKDDYNISKNEDDYLSYRFIGDYTRPLLHVRATLSGITNRGWMRDGVYYQGRYDEINAYIGLPLEAEMGNFVFLAEPRFGFMAAGNLSFQNVQNIIHRVFGIEKVHLAYDEDENIFSLALSFAGEARFRIPFYEHSALTPFIRIEALDALFYQQSLGIFAGLSLESHQKRTCNAYAGFIWANAEMGWESQIRYLERSDGWQFGFSLDAGMLSLDYITALEHGTGLGTIAINALSLFEKSTWKRSDYRVIIGAELLRGPSTNLTSMNIELPLFDSPFSIRAGLSYGSGAPQFGYSDDFYFKKNVGVFRLDAIWYGSSNWWVSPYALAGISLKKWNGTCYYNMSPPYTVENEKVFNSYSPGLEAEIGLVLLPEGCWKSDDVTYRFSVGVGISYNFFAHDARESAQRKLEAKGIGTNDAKDISAIINPLEWRINAALIIGIDN